MAGGGLAAFVESSIVDASPSRVRDIVHSLATQCLVPLKRVVTRSDEMAQPPHHRPFSPRRTGGEGRQNG